MRPIVRGNCPIGGDGKQIVFAEYRDARKELIHRLGQYCSYCEMKLGSSLAVEHVRPKKPPGATVDDLSRSLDWSNFLLACTNCNSTKGNVDIVLSDYVWPDCDNTFNAFVYKKGGVVEVKQYEKHTQQAKNLFDLVGLGKRPNTSDASDRRWLNRRDAWNSAVDSKADLANCDTEEMRRQIVRTAISGFWSIWVTVFSDDPGMIQRLIDAYPGTCQECFDAKNKLAPTPRPGGQC